MYSQNWCKKHIPVCISPTEASPEAREPLGQLCGHGFLARKSGPTFKLRPSWLPSPCIYWPHTKVRCHKTKVEMSRVPTRGLCSQYMVEVFPWVPERLKEQMQVARETNSRSCWTMAEWEMDPRCYPGPSFDLCRQALGKGDGFRASQVVLHHLQ